MVILYMYYYMKYLLPWKTSYHDAPVREENEWTWRLQEGPRPLRVSTHRENRVFAAHREKKHDFIYFIFISFRK